MDNSLEDAIRFISLELKENAGANRAKLIDEASQRFDLTPVQTEFLVNKFVLSR